MKFGLRILSFVSSLFLFIAPHVVYSQTDFFKDNVSAPLFPGCNAESCSNKELANYISSNILFPSSADPNGVLMYAGITIDENGKMQGGIKVFHSISKEADDQVYRLYGGLKNRGLWTPRTIDGGPVSTTVLIPIVFKRGSISDQSLEDLKNEKKEPEGFDVIMDYVTVGGFKESEEIFKVVETMPRFPGCEKEEWSAIERKACADKEFVEYIYRHLNYPRIAKANKIEGRVYVQYVVEKDGYLSDIKLVRDIGYGCGEAALAVVEGMNYLPERWTPGTIRGGKSVRVLYTLPVTFKLPPED